MKTIRLTALSIVSVLCTVFCFAQRPTPTQLVEAVHLREEGHTADAIALLLPSVQPSAHIFAVNEIGIAWNVLGSAYQDSEQYEKARRCYEAALQKLQDDPSLRAQYASALDNLGSLNLSMGQLQDATNFRLRARSVYREIGNHAGIARTSSNLAVVSLRSNDLRATRRYLSDAFAEAEMSKDLSFGDWGAMYAAEGKLASANQDYAGAIRSYHLAIDKWTQGYGPNYPGLGAGYAFLGQAYSQMGRNEEALSNLKGALAMEEKSTLGKTSVRYLQTAIVYARLLRSSGSNAEGSLLEEQAQTALVNLQKHDCGGCTVSAESFR